MLTLFSQVRWPPVLDPHANTSYAAAMCACSEDVNAAVSAVCDHFVEGDEVLLIGQRHDVPLEEELDFFAPEGVTDKVI